MSHFLRHLTFYAKRSKLEKWSILPKKMVRILPSLVSTLSEKFYCKAVLNIANKLKLNIVFNL